MASTTNPPKSFLIAIFPGFQLLDVAGPLDILNILSSPPLNADITMKFVGESIHPIGTKLVDDNGWTYDTKAAGFDSVNADFNQQITPDVTFDEVLAGEEEYDVLFIPGGIGTRVQRSPRTGGSSSLAVHLLIEFTKTIQHRLKTGIMTVCTGSDVVGHTSLIDNRRATTNMTRFGDVAARHKNVKWIKGARWVKSPRDETDTSKGNAEIEIWTSAGVSAGIDLTLAFVARYFGGMEVARDIARKVEYDYSEPGDGEICKFYERYFGVE